MNFTDICGAFNRSLSYMGSRKKLILTYAVLLVCGLLVIFFRGIASQSGPWTLMSLTFLPIFISSGFLLALGILLIRIYHDEVKQRPINYWDITAKSWDTVVGASYFSIPILLAYLAVWLVFAVFMLLKAIPGVGDFFAVILAFVPFTLNIATLALCVLSWAILFFVSPLVALRGMDRFRVIEALGQRIKKDPFSHILLAIVGIIPLKIVGFIALLAVWMTEAMCFSCMGPLSRIVESFFIMIPLAAVLTPVTIFFFNFAAETHILLQRNDSKG